jgi:hypothetical protein
MFSLRRCSARPSIPGAPSLTNTPFRITRTLPDFSPKADSKACRVASETATTASAFP